MLYLGHSLFVGLIFKNPVRYDFEIRYLNPFRYQMSISTFHVTIYLKIRSSCQGERGIGRGGWWGERGWEIYERLSLSLCIWAQFIGWRTKGHTNDCAHNTFLLLQKHLTSGTELILIGWKFVPNEEHVQCDHRFASQPLASEPLHSSQLVDTSLQKAHGTTSLCGPWAALHFLAFSGLQRRPLACCDWVFESHRGAWRFVCCKRCVVR